MVYIVYISADEYSSRMITGIVNSYACIARDNQTLGGYCFLCPFQVSETGFVFKTVKISNKL